ncbi:type VII secretion protein EccB [Streptomyces fuscichromogenes]|uniref:type VII secretion protein EccB n=1 Tax=Streptomyces fuscichromogenes TaxID=1324013 RepID=UPI0037F37879
MQSRRDQVQAHMFVMGRITTSMLRSDPDAPESPQGRTNRGTVVGVVIAVLMCAGAFVLGLISPGTSSSWRDGQSLVIDKQTGSRYLYLGGRLRPVRNYASALLIGGSSLASVTVSTASLDGTAHGRPVGTSGAPDSLPSAARLDTGPWQVCSSVPDAAAGSSLATTLAVGTGAVGTALGSDQALLVAGPDANDYLVWQGSRHRIDTSNGAMDALGYGTHTPLPVSAAFLDALAAGPDLAAPDTPGMGAAGPTLDGRHTRVGQVFEVAVLGSAPQYYQLRQGGLTPVTTTVADLLLGDPQVRQKAYGGGRATATGLDTGALTGNMASRSDGNDDSGPGTLPQSPPRLLAAGQGQDACVRVQPGSAGLQISVAVADDADLGPAAEPTPGALDACVPVDRITVRPGGGALVRALAADGRAKGGTVYLMTDTGMKYLVSSAGALKALGYIAGQAEGLPSSLLSMLPTGPNLSTADASAGRAVATTPTCGTAPGAGSGAGQKRPQEQGKAGASPAR